MVNDYSVISVLLVDDDVAFRTYVKKLLELRFAVNVTDLDNPGKAFLWLNENKPDLIVMDMQMPVMDGFSAIKIIRANPKTANTHILACSALSSLSLVKALYDLNITDYIVKPGNADMISEKFLQVFDKILREKLIEEQKKLFND